MIDVNTTLKEGLGIWGVTLPPLEDGLQDKGNFDTARDGVFVGKHDARNSAI
jgi:hypothetical protein